MISRRQFIVTGIAAAAAPAFAQETYPSRPIRVLVGHAAGGGVDILARNLGEYIRPLLGQPFVVENKPGANGMIGAQQAAVAPPDGYTLLMASAGGRGRTRLHTSDMSIFLGLLLRFKKTGSGVGFFHCSAMRSLRLSIA